MEKRRLGRTGHQSTVAIFGAAAFYETTPDIVDQVMEQVIKAGINHIDVAPGYGMAEDMLGPWMEKERQRFFLGCKTQLRTKEDAATELRRSLEKLRLDRFDLFQLHAITTMEELDQVTGPGGALEAILEARDEGLADYIGITGHGNDVPSVFLAALERFDFDTLLFPINFVQYAIPAYRHNTEKLLEVCRQREIGSMIIKSVAKRPWGDQAKTYTTWYEPFDEIETIQQGVNFALSQDVSGLCTPADVDILPIFLQACGAYTPMSFERQKDLISQAGKFATIFDWENN
ncbi:MAG: aldo/keto reductase [Anaerolineales bacterium]|jgi:aryl-alcohol dehydrogenase-like predicted oxidoreductase